MPKEHRKPTIWFVRQNGHVYGPFDSARLKKLADARKIHPTSEVTKQLPGPWAEASLVRGLFTSAKPADSELPTVAFPEVKAGSGRWYYREMGKDDEKASGPHTADEMERLIDRGVVRASTLVIQEGESKWETAFSSGLYLDDPCDEEESSKVKQDPQRKIAADTSHQSNSASRGNSEPETILWSGKPTHHAKYGTYALCVLTAPLVLPAIWGIKKFAERDATRYQITSQRVRIKVGARSKKQRIDIPLRDISDARMVSPASLQQTDVCNIELWGNSSKKPLATLEGLPLNQSAFIISLCEAALHRHIPTQMAARLVTDTAAQEAEIRRRAEERHRFEQDLLRMQARDAEQRARQAEVQADAMRAFLGAVPSAATAGFNWGNSWTPPPVIKPKVRPVSGVASWWFGAGKKSRTVRVRGHYRGRTWVRAHDRHLT
jgi:hypothetical protein